MASKRVPLADNPNAANSPFRSATTAAKRPRGQLNDLLDHERAAHSPPKKKQLLAITDNGTRRVHSIPLDEREGKIFGARPDNTPPNAFQKKLVAAVRDGRLQQPQQQQQQQQQREREQLHVDSRNKEREREKTNQADVETIRQWRRHYRKVFPSFVFYLESLPQDTCLRCSRQITTLGAVSTTQSFSHLH